MQGGEIKKDDPAVARHLLILDNAIHTEIYHPVDHWIRYVPPGVRITVQRREDPVPRLATFTHVLITGSESSILDPDPWVEEQLSLIKEAAVKGVPLLGSCHGHQMIAYAFGGPGSVAESPTPEFGWIEIEILAEDPIFLDAQRPVHSFCSHFDEVAAPPVGFRVLARSAGCRVQAMVKDDAPVYGIQAHPEITPTEGEELLADFAPLFPAMAKALVQRPARDSGLAATMMAIFFEM